MLAPNQIQGASSHRQRQIRWDPTKGPARNLSKGALETSTHISRLLSLDAFSGRPRLGRYSLVWRPVHLHVTSASIVLFPHLGIQTEKSPGLQAPCSGPSSHAHLLPHSPRSPASKLRLGTQLPLGTTTPFIPLFLLDRGN